MTTTTNASLTDRYVAAALKGVQTDQREDVAAELRGSIADAVEVRTSQGESPDTAERAVLLELGDPTRLAAEYSGRPLYLIGPDGDWLRQCTYGTPAADILADLQPRL